MANNDPGAALYRLLAESNSRAKHCLSISKSAAKSLEGRTQGMAQQIAELRQTIQAQGLGTDPASEDRYLELLRDYRSLHQSSALNRHIPEPPTPIPSELAKTLRWGHLLLSVYGGQRRLIKGCLTDIWNARQELAKWNDPRAIALESQLANLTHHDP